jgi:hypothetical protein
MDMNAAAHYQLRNLIDDLVVGHPGQRPPTVFLLQQSPHGAHFENVGFVLPESLTSYKAIL